MIFLLLLLILLVLSAALKKGGGPAMQKSPAEDTVRGASLIYADQKKGGKNEEGFGKLLYSAKYDLQGKPDLVFQKNISGSIIPVELKSGSIKEAELPHRGDLLQLAAYFLLLEDVYDKRPAYGRLVYRDYMFTVKNTKQIRKEVLHTMKEMREMLETGKGKPENSFAHCRPCICNGTVCPYSAAAEKE